MAGMRDAITGVPAARASDTTLAPPSISEVTARSRERAIRARAFHPGS